MPREPARSNTVAMSAPLWLAKPMGSAVGLSTLERRRRAEHHAVRGADPPEAIGPDEAHTAGACRSHDLRLERRALGTLVGEFASDDDAAADADLRAMRHHLSDARTRHRHHHHV